MAFAFLFSLSNYDFYVTPPPDYLSFRATAVSLAQLEFPESFKRAPVYPAAMALVRLVAPGPDPFLTAASVLNVFAALAVLALTYYWTRPRLGRWAPLAAALVATSSQFPLLAALPLCEMVYVALILAAVATAGRGSGWAYVWAGAAAATRYEALALIPLVALCDVPSWRSRPRVIWYALLAAVPAAAWLLVGYMRTGSPNPYVEEIRALAAVGWAFPRALVASFYKPARPGLWVVTGAFGALAAIGCVKLALRGSAGERAYLGFAVVYSLVHVVFPFSFQRFVLPLWPLLVLAFLEGGKVLCRAVATLRLGKWWYAAAAVSFGVFAAGLGWRLVTWRGGSPETLFFAGLVPLAVLAACVAWGVAGARLGPRRWALAAAALVAVGLFVGDNFRTYVDERETIKYHRASLKGAASWLERAAGRDDVIITADPFLFDYYAGPAGPAARLPASFHTDDFALFTARARRAGVTYVCYDSVSGGNADGYFARRAGVGVLRPLAAGRDLGRYYFIAKVETPGEYAYVYRLAAEPRGWKPARWGKELED